MTNKLVRLPDHGYILRTTFLLHNTTLHNIPLIVGGQNYIHYIPICWTGYIFCELYVFVFLNGVGGGGEAYDVTNHANAEDLSV